MKHRNLGFLSVSLVIGSVVSTWITVLEFLNPIYDGDLDHELYFGGELLQGRLIWVEEFHDKLPFLQIVFAVVSFLGDIWAWRLISVASVLLAVAVALRNYPLILKPLGERESKQVAVLSGILLIFLVSQSPGGLTHINGSAASFAIISAILAARLVVGGMEARGSGLAILAFSVSSAVAVSIRPYFVIPISALLVFILISLIKTPKSEFSRKSLILGIASLTVPPALTFLFNFLPYAISLKTSVFWDGLDVLAQRTNPTSGWTGFMSNFYGFPFQFTSYRFVWLPALIAWSIGFIVLFLTKRNQNLFINLIIPSGVILLFFSIMTQHWWPHYSVLFGWYAAVLVAYGLISALPPSVRAGLLVPSLLLVASIALVYLNLQTTRSQNSFELRQANVIWYKNVLESRFEELPSFLAPNDMYLHFRLGQPRHGFPHGSNSAHVAWGWWSSLSGSGHLLIPNTIEDYCSMIRDSDFRVLILEETSPYINCSLDLTKWEMTRFYAGFDPVGREVNFFVRNKK